MKLAAWDMVGFLIGPIMASILLEVGGLRLPFIVLTVMLILVFPFVARVEVPGSTEPMKTCANATDAWRWAFLALGGVLFGDRRV